MAFKKPFQKKRYRPGINGKVDEVGKPGRLYIGNLKYSLSEEQVKTDFEEFGPVEDVQLLLDTKSRSRGFGFVQFARAEDAEKCLKNVLGTLYHDRPIKIKKAKTKGEILSEQSEEEEEDTVEDEKKPKKVSAFVKKTEVKNEKKPKKIVPQKPKKKENRKKTPRKRKPLHSVRIVRPFEPNVGGKSTVKMKSELAALGSTEILQKKRRLPRPPGVREFGRKVDALERLLPKSKSKTPPPGFADKDRKSSPEIEEVDNLFSAIDLTTPAIDLTAYEPPIPVISTFPIAPGRAAANFRNPPPPPRKPTMKPRLPSPPKAIGPLRLQKPAVDSWEDVFDPQPVTSKQRFPPVPEATYFQNKHVKVRQRLYRPDQKSDSQTNLRTETSTKTKPRKLNAKAREFLPQAPVPVTKQTRPISTYRSYDRLSYSPTMRVVSPNVISKPRVVYVPKQVLLGMPMTQRNEASYTTHESPTYFTRQQYPPTPPPPNHGLWRQGDWRRECGNPEDRAYYVDEKHRVPEKYEKYSWN